MDSSTNTTAKPARLGGRLLRIGALAGLALGLSFVADLLMLSLFRPSLDVMSGIFHYGMIPTVKPTVAPALILILFSLGACGFAGWRLVMRGKAGLVYSALVIAAVFVTDLLILAFLLPGVMDPLTDLMSQSHASDFGFCLMLAVAIPMIVMALVFRMRSWRWMALSYAAVGLLLAWLATDEVPHGQPLAFEQISPVLPGAAAAYNVLMRYGKNHPLGKSFRSPDQIFKGSGKFVSAGKPDEWPAWLKTHRTDVEHDWAQLAPVRAWIDELNTFDHIADLAPADVKAEIITFGPFRSYTHDACAIAGQQALDGHGDEAAATLLPLIQVSRKLEPSSRSLVRGMIARVMQGEGVSAARFVLAHATVSPEMRGRLASALSLGVGGEAGVRHLLSVETTLFSNATSFRSLGEFTSLDHHSVFFQESLNVTGPFLYNRWRTANLHREFAETVQDLAARRDFAGLKQAEKAFGAEHARPKFKNFMGDFIVGATVPAYQKVAEAYWRIEDSRTELLAQLAQSSAGGKTLAALAP